jgi:hypothetical protein
VDILNRYSVNFPHNLPSGQVVKRREAKSTSLNPVVVAGFIDSVVVAVQLVYSDKDRVCFLGFISSFFV